LRRRARLYNRDVLIIDIIASKNIPLYLLYVWLYNNEEIWTVED